MRKGGERGGSAGRVEKRGERGGERTYCRRERGGVAREKEGEERG